MKRAPTFKITIEAHVNDMKAISDQLLKMFGTLDKTPILKGVNPVNLVQTRTYEEVVVK